MDRDLFIPILLGTTRKGRESENVARFVHDLLEARDGIETQFFDARDFDLPHDHYGMEIKDRFPEWRDAIIRADGLVLVVPEYNRSIPGVAKAIMDLLLEEYIHKAIGLVSVSAGGWGGVRVVESMLSMIRELGLVATFTDLNFPKVADKFDDDGRLTAEIYHRLGDEFLTELIWMATTLRWGRENLPSKYHSK